MTEPETLKPFRGQDTEENYGLIRPSLIKYLRSILDQYPDDGQILKELLQNAEDAGATEAKFLFDDNWYEKGSLHHPDLAEFQGPALFAFNNALFEEKDWTGIRMLQDSIKEKDPLKVGRFGLGFKSVLHMTDLPSVISADRLFMIDPHEKYFQYKGDKTSGYSWHLKQMQKAMDMISDQFKPYTGKFNCTKDTFREGFYHGTLFRFPLRTAKSSLSATVYDSERMMDMFRVFEADAHMLLLFLKHLESIQLYKIPRGKNDPRILFEVRLKSDCVEYIRKMREDFMQRCLNSEAPDGVCINYVLTIETVKHNPEGSPVSKVYKWLINEYKAGKNVSVQLRQLQNDPSLNLVPLIGTALAVDQPRHDEHSRGCDNEESPDSDSATNEALNEVLQSRPEGQVFCFLPLPIEQKTATGLPVHINGYFAISQNRRHLKWPTKGHSIKSDKSVLWNQCLLQELLPVSYTELLLYSTQLAVSSSIVSPNDIYYAVPDLVTVDQKWQFILEPLFNSIFTHPLIYTAANGGQWVKTNEVVFNWMKEDPETTNAVVDVLMKCGLKVAAVPKHMLHALGAFSQEALDVISPILVRAELKDKPDICRMIIRNDALLILRYCLKDEDFQDIIGLHLLPLADTTFVPFLNNGEQVYIPTHEAPRELFPGLESCFIADNLDDLLMYKLCKVADEGVSQLKYITKEAAAILIPRLIPLECCSDDLLIIPRANCSLSVEWLELFWTYLRKQYPNDIQMFSGLPVLPLNSTPPIQLAPLVLSGPCIVKSAMGVEVDINLLPTLDIFGVHIIRELPDYVQCHGTVLGNYARLPFSDDLIDVLFLRYRQGKNGAQLLTQLHRDTNVLEKKALVQLIGGLTPGSLAKSCIQFLRKLAIFSSTQCKDGSEDFVSVEAVPQAVDMSSLPCTISQRFIDVSESSAARAARVLNACILDEKDLLQTCVFADIKEHKHDAATIHRIVLPILNRFSDYAQNDSFITQMASISFVLTGSGQLKKPCELMDPGDELLMELAGEEENLFPTGVYAEPHLLIHLRQLGMKTTATVTAEDIRLHMSEVKALCAEQATASKAVKKGKALLNLLCYRPELLLESVQGKLLVEWACDMPWVPVLQKKPTLFPVSLDWFTAGTTEKPSKISCLNHVPLVGSVRAIIDGEVNRNVMDMFGWNEPPALNFVISQLEQMVRQYIPKEKAKYLTLLTSIYNYLMQKDSSEVCSALQRSHLDQWIWHGDGFTSLESIVAENTFTDLSPYVYCLPSEMMPFLTLFKSQGLNKSCSLERLLQVLHQISDSIGHPRISATRMEQLLQLAVNILNFVREQPLGEKNRKQILVPAMGDDHHIFKMLPLNSCTYCDVDWIRKGFDLMEFDEQDGITFIHPNLPVSTAAKLGVPTLMSRMLHAEELAITGFGQGEPLTLRLNQLLEDYMDGLAVFKEMIQNADDAGATEINFMYDERTNEDSMRYLIDEGMRACQGPALWIHNNAVFTDEDFVNITKLGGATKQLQSEKIGTFGLGFNVVYNITDVPSFISRNSIVFFDPHTTHLGKGIKDKSRPGIKIDMTKNKTLLKKLSDQFRPYMDIFGCNVSGEGHYEGTLFRLPLRTKQQAAKSEISSLHYDSSEVLALFNLFVKHAHNLLLFTQNLQRIELHHIPSDGKPVDAQKIFVLEKDILKTLRHKAMVPHQTKDSSENRMAFLQAAAQYVKNITKPATSRTSSVSQVPELSLLIQTTAKMINNDLGLTVEGSEGVHHWLISLCVGQEHSKKMTLKSKDHLVPAGGIAVYLKKVDKGFIPENIGAVCKGLAFCFLPLPITTGLPVHVNGMFALESSRKHLSQKLDDDKEDFKAEWNEALLEDAIVSAYVQGLWDLKQILPYEQEVLFYELWPVSSFTQAYFQPLVINFYKNVSTLLQMPLCSRNGTIISLSNAVFLDLPKSVSKRIAECLVSAFSQCSEDCHVLTPPEFVIRSFKSTGYENLLAEKHYNIQRFYSEIFFPNINTLDSDLRDTLVIYALRLNSKELNALLMMQDCIPVSPEGKLLRKASDLVHPTSLASKLYVPEDGRFPYGKLFSDSNVLNCLQVLGMKVNNVSWQDLVERAKSVQAAYDANESVGKERLHSVLVFLDRKLLQMTTSLPPYKGWQQMAASDDDEISTCSHNLKSISFLPVLRKPDNCPISWKSDELQPNELVSSSDLYPKEARHLVSAVHLIVNEEHMTARVKDFFGFAKRVITVEQVLTQLEHVLVIDLKLLNNKQKYEEVEKTVYDIYSYIQNVLVNDIELGNEMCQSLRERPCIIIGDQFLKPTQLAMNFQYDCSPYLYTIPTTIRLEFKPLMSKLGVKDCFSAKEYVEVLQELHKESDGKELNSRHLDIALRITTELNNNLRISKLTVRDVTEKYGEIYIPDAKGRLQPSRFLCYNDCPWIKETSVTNFTHPDITYTTSACLGVKTKRQETLNKFAKGIPFGQKEQLTNSLKRILSTYPCDHEILKEMIQNADDAEATEIHFIRDSRQHPKEHVFEDCWKPLQGPALCIYNDRPFTQTDLEGIQRLGEGSKREDPSKTGQYGIGFSSVYHLTDAPSLLTTSSETGKTLCVFDPHCYYVPGASQSEPGMRYENVDELEVAFRDVFSCYLTDKFNVEKGTMFRLPLRTSEMAKESKISNQHITMSRVHTILDKLRSEAFDILLFANHLNEIKISDIDPLTGNLINTYMIKLILSEKDSQTRRQIAEQTKEWSKRLKEGSASLFDIEQKEYVYMAYLADSSGKQEKWSISHVLGFQKDEVIPDIVQNAFEDGSLVLMPRGGVACLLEEQINGQSISSNKDMSAFCFLPLPVKTGLPVHVNSHFALGHENRRHLWTKGDSESDYHKAWNDLMCSTVIAESYVNLLKHIRMQVWAVNLENDKATVTCTRQILNCALDTYTSCFPMLEGTHPDWRNLAVSVYVMIAKRHAPVLPAVQECGLSDTSRNKQSVEQWCITWMSPVGDGADKAFFVKPEKESNAPQQTSSFFGRFTNIFRITSNKQMKSDAQILREVLLKCGLRLVEAPSSLVENFVASGVSIDFMNPDGVIAFLQSHSNENSTCKVGTLPCRLSMTPFEDEKQLSIIIQYCKIQDDFKNRLHGLPLLLTEDEMLRAFDSDSPVYYSKYSGLFPQRGDCFLKKTLLDFTFKDIDLSKCDVFKHLGIAELDSVLPSQLPVSVLRCGKPVEWEKLNSSFPTEAWLKGIWTFLSEQMASDFTLERKPDVKKILSPLSDWCLLPAKVGRKNYLYPFSCASDLIHYSHLDYELSRVQSILQKLGIPELDVVAITTICSSNIDVAKCIVTTFDKPCMVLKMLHTHLVGKNPILAIPKEVANCILEYFVYNIEQLKVEESASTLRDLPLFTTVCGRVISLTDCVVYTLPSKIPTDGVDIWQNESGTVFLERNDDLQELYDYLGCASIDIVDVYSQFIFQHLEYFPEDDRMVHLYHVYSRYLKESAVHSSLLPQESRENLLAVLRQMPFIDDGCGELKVASEFYDPNNVVFKVMLSEDQFAPVPSNSPFKESEWYDFLGKLGLTREMNREMFVEFATQVACDGHVHDKNLALAKSKVLVQHLYGMASSSRKTILPEISEIRFIAQADASACLKMICPQYGDTGTGTLHFTSFRNSISKNYEKLIWTQTALLPEWASPAEQHNLQENEIQEIMDGLKLQNKPQPEMVVQHLLYLCHHIIDSSPKVNQAEAKIIREIFTEIYRYLRYSAMYNTNVKDMLSNEPVILLSEGGLVKPCQTVVNLYEADEIKPFLLKVPLYLGEFVPFFKLLGTTERVSIAQYVAVLEALKKQVGINKCSPNELKNVFKAVKGLLEVLENGDDRDVDVPMLYLPNEAGCLVSANNLIFNDTPSFYDRVKQFGIPFVADVRECGLKSRHADELLALLPQRVRPVMLSALVREELTEDCKQTEKREGLAVMLDERVRSEVFLAAIVRLVRHQAHKTGQKVDEKYMFHVLDRLSTIQISGVDKVTTHLTFKGKHIEGSEIEKACFVERIQGHTSDICQWNLYIKKDSSLRHDLLVPLAEVINSILSDMLHESVLYLLPVLCCTENDVQSRLDSLNIRLDHLQPASRKFLLPTLGSEVEEELREQLHWGQVDFEIGEYVGFKVNAESGIIHAQVKEEVMSPHDNRMYLIDIGHEQNAVIADASQLFKFQHH